MRTFEGERYDFQAIGGFVLARATAPNDTFQVQIETAASWTIDAASVTTQAAAQVGAHVVTFGAGWDTPVWLDGAPDTALVANGAAQDLGAGSLRAISPTEFQLTWSTGESLTVTDAGPYLDDSVSLGAAQGPGSVQGLLGSNSGQATDFRLADGTVLYGPLTDATLDGVFADAWRVNPSTLLLRDVPLQFIRDGAVVTAATAPRQVLSAGAGEDVLSDAGGFGAIFSGTLTDLAAEAIEDFTAKNLIDIAGLDAARTRLAWSSGELTICDGTHTGDLRIAGPAETAMFNARSDGHGGTLIGLQ
jgi:hypothetical protein